MCEGDTSSLRLRVLCLPVRSTAVAALSSKCLLANEGRQVRRVPSPTSGERGESSPVRPDMQLVLLTLPAHDDGDVLQPSIFPRVGFEEVACSMRVTAPAKKFFALLAFDCGYLADTASRKPTRIG